MARFFGLFNDASSIVWSIAWNDEMFVSVGLQTCRRELSWPISGYSVAHFLRAREAASGRSASVTSMSRVGRGSRRLKGSIEVIIAFGKKLPLLQQMLKILFS